MICVSSYLVRLCNGMSSILPLSECFFLSSLSALSLQIHALMAPLCEVKGLLYRPGVCRLSH